MDLDFSFHLAHRLGGHKNDEFGLLVIMSLFKDEIPWLYELGLEAFRNLSGESGHTRTLASMQRLRRACELIMHEPIFRETLSGEEIMISFMELRSYLEHWDVVHTRSEGVRKKSAESPKA